MNNNHTVPAVGSVIPSNYQRYDHLPSAGNVYTKPPKKGGAISSIKSQAVKKGADKLFGTTGSNKQSTKSGSWFKSNSGSGSKSGSNSGYKSGGGSYKGGSSGSGSSGGRVSGGKVGK